MNNFECPRRIERYAIALYRMTNSQIDDFIESALDPTAIVIDDDGKEIPPEDHWKDDETCSYCASISPKLLFQAIENDLEIIPTDKNYKIYVGHKNKFYTQHLNRENSDRLRKLLDDGKIKLAYPGYFYSGLRLSSPKESE